MNRIILIGNGFDLAHGLKTQYKDFINWYWRETIGQLRFIHSNTYSNLLCDLVCKTDNWNNYWFYNQKLLYNREDFTDLFHVIKNDSEQFSVQLCPFFEKINMCIETKGWVDIEKEYYYFLQKCQEGIDYYTPEILNKELDYLKEQLCKYLKQVGEAQINKSTLASINGPIRQNEISIESNSIWFDVIDSRIQEIRSSQYYLIDNLELTPQERVDARSFANSHHNDWISSELNNLPKQLMRPNRTLILDFNYTSTANMYLANDNYQIIKIHGLLEEPDKMIFGYGDELDDAYRSLLLSDDKEYMRNIKSLKYLETDNYKRLLSFAESAPYQIFIMGHSCGKSDGTLLNTLFEDKNCISIKPYFHKREDGTDDYFDITQNIAKNFTDMKKMRDLVVNKNFCEPLPQKVILA